MARKKCSGEIYRARYYDPSTGRFLTEDPIAFSGGFNFYRYAAANPVNFRDPYGLCTIDLYFVSPAASPVGKHAFIVVTDPFVTQRQARYGYAAMEIRAAPTEPVSVFDAFVDSYTGDAEPGNYIHGEIVPFNKDAPDYPDPDSASLNLLKNNCSCKEYMSMARKIVNHINDSKIEFNAINQNSNAFVTTVLDGLGLSYPQTPPVWAPGWGNNLFRRGEYFPPY